jgi:hypothetical protein
MAPTSQGSEPPANPARFKPSLDRGRIMALAELKFIDRSEAVHFVGPPESAS